MEHRVVRYVYSVAIAAALVSVAFLLAFCSFAAHAQGFPDKPIRIMVGASPGGGTDILARLLKVVPVDENEAEQSGKLPKLFKSANVG